MLHSSCEDSAVAVRGLETAFAEAGLSFCIASCLAAALSFCFSRSERSGASSGAGEVGVAGGIADAVGVGTPGAAGAGAWTSILTTMGSGAHKNDLYRRPSKQIRVNQRAAVAVRVGGLDRLYLDAWVCRTDHPQAVRFPTAAQIVRFRSVAEVLNMMLQVLIFLSASVQCMQQEDDGHNP